MHFFSLFLGKKEFLDPKHVDWVRESIVSLKPAILAGTAVGPFNLSFTHFPQESCPLESCRCPSWNESEDVNLSPKEVDCIRHMWHCPDLFKNWGLIPAAAKIASNRVLVLNSLQEVLGSKTPAYPRCCPLSGQSMSSSCCYGGLQAQLLSVWLADAEVPSQLQSSPGRWLVLV